MNIKTAPFHICVIVLVLTYVVPSNFAIAQQVTLNMEASATLENAQVLSLTGLGLNKGDNGPALISATIENLTNDAINNLYLELIVRGAKVGTILKAVQNHNNAFSLGARQSVYFTNNDLRNERIPGLSARMIFDGGFTAKGEDFLSNLSGSTTLPEDIYSLEMNLFRVTNAKGRQSLARDVIEVGGGNFAAFSYDEQSVYLKAPGAAAGILTEITNPYPQFSWEGGAGSTYRLLVVRQQGQDAPESLLEGAKSSMPATNGGDLLAYEIADVLVEGTSYQLPTSGVQALEAGKTYYWQVIKTLQVSGDTEDISSEIWSFKLGDASKGPNEAPELDGELARMLTQLIGEDAFRRLKAQGFRLEAIEYDGGEFTGVAATLKLEELLQKIQEEIIIIDQQ